MPTIDEILTGQGLGVDRGSDAGPITFARPRTTRSMEPRETEAEKIEARSRQERFDEIVALKDEADSMLARAEATGDTRLAAEAQFLFDRVAERTRQLTGEAPPAPTGTDFRAAAAGMAGLATPAVGGEPTEETVAPFSGETVRRAGTLATLLAMERFGGTPAAGRAPGFGARLGAAARGVRAAQLGELAGAARTATRFPIASAATEIAARGLTEGATPAAETLLSQAAAAAPAFAIGGPVGLAAGLGAREVISLLPSFPVFDPTDTGGVPGLRVVPGEEAVRNVGRNIRVGGRELVRAGLRLLRGR